MTDRERATIRFEPSGRAVTVGVGETLLAAARRAGVAIDAPCGGTGRCGSCRVRAEGMLSPLSADESELLGGASVAAGRRLACRARAEGDVTVTVPEPVADARIVGESGQVPAEVEPPERRGIDALGPLAGAAIDLGTTTIAVLLVDLRSGETLASAGALNPQRAYGADVLSRVAYAMHGGAAELQHAVARPLDAMLVEALERAGLPREALVEAVVVGNTAMTGLLAGADVAPLGEAPYEGAPVVEAVLPAHALGMSTFPSLDLLVPPAAGAFIGSDITAGIAAADIEGRPGATLFIDLGTNGEIVLSADGELVAASTAAGPAFEGAAIECGMRAVAGAVERVWLVDGDVRLGVIGDREPAGICGSGLLDLIAVLLDAGIVEASGRMADEADGLLGERLASRDGVRAFRVDARGDVMLTQKDVRQVQLAVGAIRAGTTLLLQEAGRGTGDVANVVVAGGFGYHVRGEALVRLGLLPAEWAGRVTFAGNTALEGARRALLGSGERERIRGIASRTRIVDLAAHADFQARFLESLSFPG